MKLRLISEVIVAEWDQVTPHLRKLLQVWSRRGVVNREQYQQFKREYDRLDRRQQQELLANLTQQEREQVIQLMKQENQREVNPTGGNDGVVDQNPQRPQPTP